MPMNTVFGAPPGVVKVATVSKLTLRLTMSAPLRVPRSKAMAVNVSTAVAPCASG